MPGKGRELNRWALAMKREEALWTLCEIQWNVNDFFGGFQKSDFEKKKPRKICKPVVFTLWELFNLRVNDLRLKCCTMLC